MTPSTRGKESTVTMSQGNIAVIFYMSDTTAREGDSIYVSDTTMYADGTYDNRYETNREIDPKELPHEWVADKKEIVTEEVPYNIELPHWGIAEKTA